jgi:hypothetical protein
MIKRQTNREEDESSVEYWARECPGQFLHVIRFGPELHQTEAAQWAQPHRPIDSARGAAASRA